MAKKKYTGEKRLYANPAKGLELRTYLKGLPSTWRKRGKDIPIPYLTCIDKHGRRMLYTEVFDCVPEKKKKHERL